jgi:hypothetical protein
MDKTIDTTKAIQILIEAVSMAQKRGAYSLEEVDVILQAVKLFTVKPEEKKEDKKEEKPVKK